MVRIHAGEPCTLLSITYRRCKISCTSLGTNSCGKHLDCARQSTPSCTLLDLIPTQPRAWKQPRTPNVTAHSARRIAPQPACQAASISGNTDAAERLVAHFSPAPTSFRVDRRRRCGRHALALPTRIPLHRLHACLWATLNPKLALAAFPGKKTGSAGFALQYLL